MAAGDFTAAVGARMVLKLEEIFQAPSPQLAHLNAPAYSAKALLEAQTARMSPIMEGGNCMGVKVFFLKSGSTDVSAPSGCAVPTGAQAEAVGMSFDNEILTHNAAVAVEGRCDTEIGFAEELAQRVAQCMADGRNKLNRDIVIARILAQRQANLDTGIPSTWDATTNTPRIDVPTAQFTWENFPEFQAAAMNNFLASPLFLSGRLFYNANANAQFQQSTDKGNLAEAYRSMGLRFDIRDLDNKLGRKSTFAIDTNSYVFWNTTWGDYLPKQTDTDIFEFIVNDPELMYNDGGSMVPVKWQVEVKRVCLDRNAIGRRRYSHTVYTRLIGGFKFGPDGTSLNPAGTVKGVLEFSAV